MLVFCRNRTSAWQIITLQTDEYLLYLRSIRLLTGASGGAIGWGTSGSIPDGVIEIFHLLNPSGRTVALGGGGGEGGRCVRVSWNLVVSISWNPRGLARPIQGLLYLHHSLNIRHSKTCYGRWRSYKDVPMGRFCSKSIKFDLVHIQKWLQESDTNEHVGNDKAALFYSALWR
jgi:hypothetical protein